MSDCTMPDCYNATVRKARKAHECSDCRGQIRAGERYHYISGIWDGEPQDYKRCADCEHMRCEVGNSGGSDNFEDCGGIPLGELREELSQMIRPEFGHLIAAFNAYAEERGAPRIESW